MRESFAVDATLQMDPLADDRAPGAAITVELCGSIEHLAPCPLAPHHTSATRTGETVRLRVLFAAEPPREDEVRARIERALRHGDWRLVEIAPGAIGPGERAHAERLAGG